MLRLLLTSLGVLFVTSQTPTLLSTTTETTTPTLSSTLSSTLTPSETSTLTPSISYTNTPTSSSSLRISALPSVTPTETPGPTNTSSPKPLAGIFPPAAAPQITTGALFGSAVGGGVVVLVLIGLAIRLKIVHAEINGPQKVKNWKLSKLHKSEFEDAITMKNPNFASRIERMQQSERTGV